MWSVLFSNLLVMWFILMPYLCIISPHRRSCDLYFHHVTGLVTFVISLSLYYFATQWTGTRILKSFCLEILIKVRLLKKIWIVKLVYARPYNYVPSNLTLQKKILTWYLNDINTLIFFIRKGTSCFMFFWIHLSYFLN